MDEAQMFVASTFPLWDRVKAGIATANRVIDMRSFFWKQHAGHCLYVSGVNSERVLDNFSDKGNRPLMDFPKNPLPPFSKGERLALKTKCAVMTLFKPDYYPGS